MENGRPGPPPLLLAAPLLGGDDRKPVILVADSGNQRIVQMDVVIARVRRLGRGPAPILEW